MCRCVGGKSCSLWLWVQRWWVLIISQQEKEEEKYLFFPHLPKLLIIVLFALSDIWKETSKIIKLWYVYPTAFHIFIKNYILKANDKLEKCSWSNAKWNKFQNLVSALFQFFVNVQRKNWSGKSSNVISFFLVILQVILMFLFIILCV